MAVTSREELIAYGRRQLGEPLIEVNVTIEQLDDAVENAISFFRDYYWDGIEQVYLKHQITAQDITNGYIVLPDLIFGVNRVFPTSGVNQTGANIFDVQYQLRMNDLRDLTSTSMIYYEQVMEHISLIDYMLNPAKQFRWNKLTNKLYIDQNWSIKAIEGDYMLIDCYRALDPVDAPKFWDDRYLKKYVTALFKKQWGSNLNKFQGISLPGGVTIDGQSIYNEGVDEAKAIEDEIMNNLAPLNFMIG